MSRRYSGGQNRRWQEYSAASTQNRLLKDFRKLVGEIRIDVEKLLPEVADPDAAQVRASYLFILQPELGKLMDPLQSNDLASFYDGYPSTLQQLEDRYSDANINAAMDKALKQAAGHQNSNELAAYHMQHAPAIVDYLKQKITAFVQTRQSQAQEAADGGRGGRG